MQITGQRRGWAAVLLLGLVATSACGSGDADEGTGSKGLDLSVVHGSWGPARQQMFTEGDRPERATLNSVTDNPRHGDERNLLSVRELPNGREQWGGDVSVHPGRTYEATMLVRNDADPGSGSGASTGTRVRAELPATVRGRAPFPVFIQSDNATPALLWQSATLTTPADSPVALRIVPDSSRVFTGAAPKGVALPAEEFFSEAGTLIGCSKPDGVLTGAPDCEGRVRFRFVADQPNFVITQSTARADGTGQSDAIRLEAGARVTYKIHYKNTGTTQQNDVVLKEELPAKFRYVAESTYLANSSTGNRWKRVSDGVISSGLNVGSYSPSGGAFMKFTVVLPSAADLDCGLTSTTSTASALTQNGGKSAESVLLVEKKCG
ncbi:hypothetical protein ABZX97_03345 [Streptomyces seoulensis]|uniref:hypothetical protein n=1 Tax=Streptomyces seoulensis TaxID=73044 RepID=UPI0033B378FB